MKRILIISNGYGEDLIGSFLVKAFQRYSTSLKCDVIPLVGKGEHYQKIGQTPLLKNPPLPSGGFLRTAQDILKDFKSGLIAQLMKQRTTIKHFSSVCDATLCVGDIFCLMMGSWRLQNHVFFMPTAKSDYFMPHSWIEKYLMKQYCEAVYPRDALTEKSLVQAGLPATFLGNPMMDHIQLENCELGIPSDHKVIGILPGSREEAYQNAAFIETLLVQLKTLYPKLTFLVAIAPMLDPVKLQRAIPSAKLSTAFYDIVHHADVIIGLSGTANEQACYYGRPVVCFPGFGPQTTHTRFIEQQKLLGNKLVFVPSQDPRAIIKVILETLKRPTPKTPPPIQNAAQKIVDHLLSQLQNTNKIG